MEAHPAMRYIQRHGILLALILMGVLLLAPLLLRVANGSPITPGAQSYLHLREADLLRAGTYGYDPMREQELVPNPYTVMLATMQFFGVPWLLPVLLGLTLVLLLYLYLSRTLHHDILVLVCLLFVILSPTMGVLGTWHSVTSLCLCLLLAALLLMDHHPVLATIITFVAIITDPATAIIGVFAVTMRLVREKRMHTIGYAALAVVAAGVWFFLWLGTAPPLVHQNAFVGGWRIFFELGGYQGVSLFFVVIAAYAAIASPFVRVDVSVRAALLLLLSFFTPELLPLTALVIAIIAACGAFQLMTTTWELELLRQMLLILLLCVGIFLVITSMRQQVAQEPSADFARSMIELGNQHRPGNVLSAPSYAPLIEYFSGRRATLTEDASEVLVRQALLTRDAQEMYDFLELTNTSYIFITDEMVTTLFTRSDDGILFLLPNTGRFVVLLQKERSILWYYIKRDHPVEAMYG